MGLVFVIVLLIAIVSLAYLVLLAQSLVYHLTRKIPGFLILHYVLLSLNLFKRAISMAAIWRHHRASKRNGVQSKTRRISYG